MLSVLSVFERSRMNAGWDSGGSRQVGCPAAVGLVLGSSIHGAAGTLSRQVG